MVSRIQPFPSVGSEFLRLQLRQLPELDCHPCLEFPEALCVVKYIHAGRTVCVPSPKLCQQH